MNVSNAQRFIDLLQHEDWEAVADEVAELARVLGPDVVPLACGLLSSENSAVRSRAAHVLRVAADPRAVKPLVDAVHAWRHTGRYGSFLWALRTQDCRDLFDFLCDMVIHGHYEARSHALAILQEQQFDLTPAQFKAASQRMNAYAKSTLLTDDDTAALRILQRIFTHMKSRVQPQSQRARRRPNGTSPSRRRHDG